MRSSLFAALVAAAAATSCGSARRGAPLAPPVALTSDAERHGELLYFRFCHPCHPFGEGGLGPSLNDKPLPELAIRAQVRAGLGAMPGFDDDLLADHELDAVVAYMKALRAGRSAADAKTAAKP